MQGSPNLLNFPKLDPTNDQVAVGATSSATGAWELYSVISAASINAASIKASPGRLGGIVVANGSSTTAYFLKLFNQTTTPDPSADSANVIFRLPLLALADLTVDFGAGVAFDTGLGIAITAGVADTDETNAAASTILANVWYK